MLKPLRNVPDRDTFKDAVSLLEEFVPWAEAGWVMTSWEAGVLAPAEKPPGERLLFPR